jgi:hypothetical protein
MQEETACGSSRSHSHSIARSDQRGEIAGATVSTAYLEEGADQVAHHVMKESVAAHGVDRARRSR